MERGFDVIEVNKYKFCLYFKQDDKENTFLSKEGERCYFLETKGLIPLYQRCYLIVFDTQPQNQEKKVKEIVPFLNSFSEYDFATREEREAHYLTSIHLGEDEPYRLRWYPSLFKQELH